MIIGAVSLPVLLVVAGIALLVAGIVLLALHWTQVWDWVKQIAGDAWTWLKANVFGPIGDFFGGLGGNIQNALATVKAIIEAPFIAAFNQMVQWYKDTLGHIFGAIHPINVVVNYKQGTATPPVSGGTGGAGIRVFASGTGMGTISGTALVGERGPELANFGRPAQIIPNSALMAGGNPAVLATLRRIEGVLLNEVPARTGAAVSSGVDSGLANVIDRHARTTLTLARSGAH